PSTRLRGGVHKPRLTVGRVEDDVDALAVCEPDDFSGDVVALVVEDVMRAGLPGQLHRLRRAATADDEIRFEQSCGDLNCQMPYATPATRDVDGVTGLDGAVKAGEGREERHWQHPRIPEPQ